MFLSFFFLLPYCYAIQWNYLPNTVWSSACDWGGNDLSNFQTTADNCGPKCLSTPGCTHFTWTTYNSGTCWLKTNWYSPSDAFDSTSSNVCGYVTYWQQSGNVVWAPYCDWQANDITGIPTTADQCGSACVNTAGCTHFTWSSGTCWVKRNSVSQSDAFLNNIEDAVCGYLTSNPSPVTPPPKPPSPPQGERLRFVNRASSKIFLFYQSPKKRLTYPNPIPMAPGAVLDFHIPDGGLESCRFWPGWGCSPDGKDCIIGASGGVFPGGMSDGSDGGLYCSKTAGCGPAIDTKLEATFGCGNPGCNDDYINTSQVDGYTLPYTFKLMTPDGRGCNGGTASTILDCSNLDLSKCPTNEYVQSVGTVNLVVRNPSTLKTAGCLSPCGYLTFRQWNPNAHYFPGDSIAKPYCCPYPGVTPSQCSSGPVVNTQYVKLIHNTCPAYSYAFDDGFALQQCPPGTKYEMTFFDPTGVNFLTEEPNINVSPKEISINVTIISVTVGTIIGIIMIVVVVIIYRNSKKSQVERSENLP